MRLMDGSADTKDGRMNWICLHAGERITASNRCINVNQLPIDSIL